MRTKRWQLHLLVLFAYTLFALALTWPVVAHIGSHVPGNGADDPPLTWNLWWVKYALLQLGTNPFDCDYMFYPLGINLAFYTLTVLNGLLSVPLQAVFGLVTVTNLLLLSSFILSGYGAFLLASHLLSWGPNIRQMNSATFRSPGFWALFFPGFTAGLLYAFASCKLAYAALGQWNITSSQWIPFYVLYLFKMGRAPSRWRYPLLAALFLLLQAYAELTYASFLILFTVLWAVWQAAARFRLAGLLRLCGNLVLIGCLFLIGLVPMLAMMIPDLLVEGDIFVEGGGFADVFSADLIGFLVPTMYHPVLGSLVKRFHFDYSVGQHLYLGYSVLVLAVTGIIHGWRRSAATPSSRPQAVTVRPARFWAFSSLAFWLLTLGPTLRVNGHDTGFPLPFALIAELPFFKGNRYPSRYSVLLFLSLAMLVALGLAALLQRRETDAPGKLRSAFRRLVPLMLVALLLFEHLSAPLPLSDMHVPPIYQAIASEMPGDFTLLDLPVAWRNGFRVTGTLHPTIMFQQYYQSVHGKRILAGNTSRNPPLKFQYFTEAPVINTLIALETGHEVDTAIVEQDRQLAADVLRFFDIEAIVVHQPQVGPDMIPYIEATMPVEPWHGDEKTVIYRVELPAWPDSWRVEPGNALSRLSYAQGWGVPASGVIWAQRKDVRLLAPLNGAEQQMAFRVYTPEEGQQLEVRVNGQAIQSMGMDPGWTDYEITLPADSVHEGLNEVQLRFETLVPASQVRLSPRAIGATGVDSPVNLAVQSAGQEVGDFGHIYVDGKDVSPNARGYNIAVIHPKTGSVVQTAAFDTHLDQGASQAMASFLTGVPAGHLVAVAVADEASRLLDQAAVDALRGIGATGDLRERFRWGQAIIGVQGAAPGTALEAMDWMRPVTLVAGEGATEPDLAMAFAIITFHTSSAP
jgi:hypothetical protein